MKGKSVTGDTEAKRRDRLNILISINSFDKDRVEKMLVAVRQSG